jgi:hypothetical protein
MPSKKQVKIILFTFLLILLLCGIGQAFSPARSLPDRCNFGPQIYCLEYEKYPAANQIYFVFKNYLTVKADFYFKATIPYEPNSSLINCSCNNASSCEVQPQGQAKVICAFPQGIITEDSLKVLFNGSYVLSNDLQIMHDFIGEIFIPAKQSFRSFMQTYDFFLILVFLMLAIIVIIYIVLIKKLAKIKTLKIWVNTGLKACLYTAIILAGVFFFFFAGYEIELVLFALLIMPLLIGSLVGLLAGLISYIKNKKKNP